MSYLQYTEDDFFHDPKFRKWVLHPDPESNYFWEKWLINHPDKKDQVKVARRLVKAIKIDETNWESERKKDLWSRINATIQQRNIQKSQSNVVQLNDYHRQNQKRKFQPIWFKAAIITVLLISTVYFVNQQDENNQPPLQITNNIVEKYNPNGQKSRVFLPDGSVVYLNSSSKITYKQEFNSGQRLVKLEGEAYFDVVRDTLRPFIVEAGNLKTTVLGTSFNINTFSENKTQVSLVKGKLKVASYRNDSNSVIIKPGQSATLYKQEEEIITGKTDYMSDIAWIDGILYFNNTPLNRAFQQLEKWYGVDFYFNNEPDDKVLITGTFENEYLSNVLKSLSYSVSFNYKIENGNEAYINFK